ncbi:hypothetical protein EDD78_10655 [Harryflintia acetispora]|uniref:Uncharacterized protein n=1 Tax=Harryflintia acetispora TaxID=1849041 RepID=A0A9X8UIP7_9FIRM|nr:hypothetical protein EDD78_10655 [Harryflintia acetispora]
MFDATKFRKELLNDFFSQHPDIQSKDILYKPIADISSKMIVMAIEKYLKENDT